MSLLAPRSRLSKYRQASALMLQVRTFCALAGWLAGSLALVWRYLILVIAALFEEWLQLYLNTVTASAATGATAAETSAMQQSAQAAYIARLQQQGTCKTDEVARKFFIVSAELCIERHLAGVLARKVPITNDTSNAQYHVVDAFARLVTLLTKHYFTDATAKVRSRQAAQRATVLELRPAAALQLTLPRPRRHRRSPHVDRCHCLPMRSTRSFACWCTMPKRGRATSINDPTIASLRCG